jgi:5-methylthioribose kinase
LNLCDGTSIGVKYGFVFSGRMAFWLKNMLDTSWMQVFHRKLSQEDEEASSWTAWLGLGWLARLLKK